MHKRPRLHRLYIRLHPHPTNMQMQRRLHSLDKLCNLHNPHSMHNLRFKCLLHLNVNFPMCRLFNHPHPMPHLYQSKYLQYLRSHVHYKSYLNSSNMQPVFIRNLELRLVFKYDHLYSMSEHLLCYGQWTMRLMLKSPARMFNMLQFNGMYRVSCWL